MGAPGQPQPQQHCSLQLRVLASCTSTPVLMFELTVVHTQERKHSNAIQQVDSHHSLQSAPRPPPQNVVPLLRKLLAVPNTAEL